MPFGIFVLPTLTPGLPTPRESAALYIGRTIFRCRIRDLVREGWLRFAAKLLVVVLVVFCPDLALSLPNLVFGKECGGARASLRT